MAETWRSIGASILTAAIAILAESEAFAAPPSSVPLVLSPAEILALSANDAAVPCERHGTRNWLRQKIVCESDLAQFGLKLDDGWERMPVEKPVVILVHGFNSCPAQNAALLKPIHDAKFPCGTFAYPNDHTIVESAQMLSCELRRFAARHPLRRVALVCHSMGSLVARECVENPRLDPGVVDRLIMIAPPTHGTLIAHFAVGTDMWEHWLARRNGGPWRRVRDSIVDGLGEAADDLCPGSEFLTNLNSRPLNPRVRYTNVLGTSARFNEAQVAWIRESVCDNLRKLPGADSSAERLEEILSDIDELVEGKGDGVVAVKRGRLNGVADTLVMPFGHLAVTGEPSTETLREVQQVVLQRVQ